MFKIYAPTTSTVYGYHTLSKDEMENENSPPGRARGARGRRDRRRVVVAVRDRRECRAMVTRSGARCLGRMIFYTWTHPECVLDVECYDCRRRDDERYRCEFSRAGPAAVRVLPIESDCDAFQRDVTRHVRYILEL